MNEPIARQLADTIRQTAFEAHTFLRHGHNEKVYENSLRNRLRKKGLTVEQQMPIAVHDEDGSSLSEFVADLVVNREFIVELKAVRTLAEEHTAQILGHLRASGIEHGMLINFCSPRIQFHKYIFRQSD
ncbi:MAG TPA: GxxExxY protein [Lacunisphaera sp.]|nr:GxxExxY protein [Lacunisphaera sp.]